MNGTHPNGGRISGNTPLAALRAFEAAARLGSFRSAAGEIGLTPSAISHHVRDLEAQFGAPLFRRGHREVSLTEAGAQLAGELSPAFARIGAAYRDLLSGKVLRLSAAPLFAARFLLPNLEALTGLLPGVGIEVESSIAPVDLAAGRHDLALRYGPSPAPPLVAAEVGGAGLVVVAAPGIVAALPDGSAGRFAGRSLLSLSRHPNAWAGVCGVLGIALPQRELFFDSYEGVLQAAKDGRGLALVPLIVCQDELARGTLVRVADHLFDNGWRYWLIGRKNVLPASQLHHVAGWMAARIKEAMPSGLNPQRERSTPLKNPLASRS